MAEPGEKKSKVSMMAMKSQSHTRSIANMGGKSMSRMKVRRASYGFGGVPGIKPVERTSQLAIEFKRPPLLYLNTYQLDPTYKFHYPTVQKATDEILDEHFTGHKYNVQESPAIALRIAGELMRKVKAMCFNRYRIITIVTIGQKRSQCYNNAISFLWDYERDNYVDVQRESSSVFIQRLFKRRRSSRIASENVTKDALKKYCTAPPKRKFIFVIKERLKTIHVEKILDTFDKDQGNFNEDIPSMKMLPQATVVCKIYGYLLHLHTVYFQTIQPDWEQTE